MSISSAVADSQARRIVCVSIASRSTQSLWMDSNDSRRTRAICEASENAIVRTLWESLARHVLIVFGQEIRDEKDAVVMGPHHRRLRDLIAAGDIDTLLREIPGHILRLRGR